MSVDPGSLPAAEGTAKQATPKELTIPEKLSEKTKTEAAKFNKLNGITHAAWRIQEARDILVGESVGFEPTHSDVVGLDAVLTDLGTYL